ncbi:MAG: hypothetical protein ACKVQJ_08110 [Pyrinomonadaceae bacterium]
MQVGQVKDDKFTITFTKDEMLIINNALNETANGIWISEFQTRTGYEREEFQKLLDQIGGVLDAIS